AWNLMATTALPTLAFRSRCGIEAWWTPMRSQTVGAHTSIPDSAPGCVTTGELKATPREPIRVGSSSHLSQLDLHTCLQITGNQALAGPDSDDGIYAAAATSKGSPAAAMVRDSTPEQFKLTHSNDDGGT